MRFTEDTNIICIAARDPGCAAQLKARRDELTAQGFRHAINPLVILELLNGLIRSNGSHFPSDQIRFRVLDYRGQSEFLRFPGAFALDQALDTRSVVTKLTPLDFERWLRAVCAAQSWDHLVRGVVSIDPSFRYTFGLNADLLAEYQYTHQQFHQERMTESRQGGDPTDGELLFYLADPEMRLLTHNGKIKGRVGESPQASQIVVLPQV
jgi:hypothetical protein